MLNEMLNNYSNILIMGYGESGKSVEKVLKTFNKNYKIYDEIVNFKSELLIKKLNKKNIKMFDLIIVSPGFSKYNKYIQYALSKKKKVVSELEFGYWFVKDYTKLIAVTGTNGKTTTVNEINKLLNLAGYKSFVAGNIGVPLSEFYNTEYDYLVVEISSFQMELTYSFKSKFCIVLNLAEDHIDRHKSYNKYCMEKLKLLKNLGLDDIAILNSNDNLIMKYTKNLNIQKFYFGMDYIQGTYIYYNNHTIMLNTDGENVQILKLENDPYYMLFMEDLLAVVSVGLLLKIDNEIIYKNISSFIKLPYRYELLPKMNKIMIINDSKSTNIHSSIKSLSVTENDDICMLVGGYSKKLNWKNFFKLLNYNKIKKLVCFSTAGNAAYKIGKRFPNMKNKIVYFSNLKKAIEYSLYSECKCILFSPACSSFDEFSNYAERGKFFNDEVNKFYKMN